jgi:DNA-binding Lrp family transcriptional regulator
MSWPYMQAAWTIPLDPRDKIVLLALSDRADLEGTVAMSQQALRDIANISEAGVKRALHTLYRMGLVERQSIAIGQTPQRFRMCLTGFNLNGVQFERGSMNGVDRVQFEPSADLLIKAVSAVKAAAPRAAVPPVENRATDKQVQKLLHVIWDEEEVDAGANVANVADLAKYQLHALALTCEPARLARNIEVVLMQRGRDQRKAAQR